VLVPREREDVLRDREPLLRVLAVPADEVLRAVELADDVRAPLARVDPELEALALVELALRPLLEREPDVFARGVEDFDRALDPRDDAPRAVGVALELPPRLEASSVVHLPDITRCAASATASAISEPSLVALAITLLAA